MAVAPLVRHKKIKSHDGTRLDYQVIGSPSKPTIILCNGLGGSVVAFEPIYARFIKDYRFICWDYRGLFRSEAPSDPERLAIPDHALDLQAIVRKEGVKKALVLGWSMGVQVCLEAYRHFPKLFAGMILLNGTSGYPFDTALNSPLSRFLLPKVNELSSRITQLLQPHFQPLANRLLDWQGFVGLVTKLGLAHKNINPTILRKVARDMLSANLQIYHEIMRHLSLHNAGPMLKTITVPALIITAGNDVITPVKTAEKMADAIPKSELFIVPQGTHYSLIEFPDEINLRISKFLSEHWRKYK